MSTRLAVISDSIQGCTQCALHEHRTNIVFGRGSADATIMLIGEAPGQQEDETGQPFVGRSGKLLDFMLDKAGIAQDDIYITNVNKCRPPNNRRPERSEVRACRSYLKKQIEAIDSLVLVTLGATATNGMLTWWRDEGEKIKSTGILTIRGREYKYAHRVLIPTVHPAYVLRNPAASKLLLQDLTHAARAAREFAAQVRRTA